MSKRNFLLFTLLLLFLPASFAEAQQEKELPFPITQYKLKNGLQIIISEDYSLPIVSVVVAYNVGSINEQPGKTGLAYLLRNLMFQGSENIGRMQHISFIHRTGGELNAATTQDKTIFSQTVPSNQLALVLWLESDRMRSLDIDDNNVIRAKDDLIEEIHQRKATDPYLESYLYFDQLLFPDFAYSHPVIGTEADVRDITVEDVKSFYSSYYIPNNAVLCITGNINKRKTKSLIQKYFETIPEGKKPPPPDLAKSSERTAKVETFRDSLASAPGFYLGYRIAPPYTVDFYPLAIIEYILLRGESSRLYKRLVKKERIAFQMSGEIEKKEDLAALKIFVINNNEVMMERSQKAIFSEINKLKSSFISEEELIRSKNMFKMDYIKQYATTVDKAIFLVETHLAKNSLDFLGDEINKYLAVTPSDIIGIANRYFTQERILLNIRIK